MNTTIEKRLNIDTQRAQRLEQLASARGMSEDILIAKALDLLFGEQDREAEEAQTALRRPFAFNVDEIVSVVGTPIDPQLLRSAGGIR